MEQKDYRSQRSYSIKKIGLVLGVSLLCLNERSTVNANTDQDSLFYKNIRQLQDNSKSASASTTTASNIDNSKAKDSTQTTTTNNTPTASTAANDSSTKDAKVTSNDNSSASSQDQTANKDATKTEKIDDKSSVSKNDQKSAKLDDSNGNTKTKDKSSEPSSDSNSQVTDQKPNPKDSNKSSNLSKVKSSTQTDNKNTQLDVKDKNKDKIVAPKTVSRRRDESEEYAVVLISFMLGMFFAGCFYFLFSGTDNPNVQVQDDVESQKEQPSILVLKPMKLNSVACEKQDGVEIVTNNNSFLKGNKQVHPVDNSKGSGAGLQSTASFLQPQALSDQNMTAQNEIGQVMLSPELNIDLENPKRVGLTERIMAPSGGKKLPPIDLPKTKPTSSIDKDRSIQ